MQERREEYINIEKFRQMYDEGNIQEGEKYYYFHRREEDVMLGTDSAETLYESATVVEVFKSIKPAAKFAFLRLYKNGYVNILRGGRGYVNIYHIAYVILVTLGRKDETDL